MLPAAPGQEGSEGRPVLSAVPAVRGKGLKAGFSLDIGENFLAVQVVIGKRTASEVTEPSPLRCWRGCGTVMRVRRSRWADARTGWSDRALAGRAQVPGRCSAPSAPGSRRLRTPAPPEPRSQHPQRPALGARGARRPHRPEPARAPPLPHGRGPAPPPPPPARRAPRDAGPRPRPRAVAVRVFERRFRHFPCARHGASERETPRLRYRSGSARCGRCPRALPALQSASAGGAGRPSLGAGLRCAALRWAAGRLRLRERCGCGTRGAWRFFGPGRRPAERPGPCAAPTAVKGRAGRPRGAASGAPAGRAGGRRRCSVMVADGGERARPGARGGPAGAGPAREGAPQDAPRPLPLGGGRWFGAGREGSAELGAGAGRGSSRGAGPGRAGGGAAAIAARGAATRGRARPGPGPSTRRERGPPAAANGPFRSPRPARSLAAISPADTAWPPKESRKCSLR